MKIFTRIWLSIFALVLGATVGISLISFYTAKSALVPKELKLLQQISAQVAERIETELGIAERNVIALAATPPIQGIVRARRHDGIDPLDGSEERRWRERLSSIFVGQITANPQIMQLRYIGVEDGGREIVRVDNSGKGDLPVICPDRELQQKGHRDYFLKTIGLPPGAIHYSPFEPNQEHGAIEVPYRPTVRISMPIHDSSGKAFGILIVNLDLTRLLAEAVRTPIDGARVFVYGGSGDFIRHPEDGRLFGSFQGHVDDAGQYFLERGVAAADMGKRSFSTMARPREGRPVAIAWSCLDRAPFESVHCAITVPASTILGSINNARSVAIATGFAIVLLGMGFAALSARHLTQPIIHIAERLSHYKFGERLTLPRVTTPEISVLSQSIEALSEKVIAETEHAQEELQERLKATAAVQARSTFLANMSHEIRTPMNGIVGMAEALSKSRLDDRQKEQSRIIRESAGVLLRIIDDILDFSKMEAGKLEIEKTRFDPRTLVRDIAALFQENAKRKGLSLGVSLPEEPAHELLGDSLRLRQILTNLVSNAVKFTASGGITVTYERIPSPGRQAPRARFAVTDTGIGIPREKIDRIFHAFEQVDSSTARVHGGTGLGLAICSKLATLMGGSLDVTSNPGRGSRFSVEIPVEVHAVEQPQVLHRPEQTAAPKLPPDLQVLVVEDHEVNRLVAEFVLGELGARCTFACNGRQALEIVHERPFDVVLMDCHMPEMDGFEATRRLRAEGFDRPIIALSASAMATDVEASRAAGMNDHVSKPIQPASLGLALTRVLQEGAAALSP